MADKKKTIISEINTTSLAKQILGHPGRMVSFSKSLGPSAAIYNSHIYSSKGIMIWNGDLDLDRDQGALLQLAQKCGTLYVLDESRGWGRKRATKKYLFDEAVVIVNGERLLADTLLFIRAKLRIKYIKKILSAKKRTKKGSRL